MRFIKDQRNQRNVTKLKNDIHTLKDLAVSINNFKAKNPIGIGRVAKLQAMLQKEYDRRLDKVANKLIKNKDLAEMVTGKKDFTTKAEVAVFLKLPPQPAKSLASAVSRTVVPPAQARERRAEQVAKKAMEPASANPKRAPARDVTVYKKPELLRTTAAKNLSGKPPGSSGNNATMATAKSTVTAAAAKADPKKSASVANTPTKTR